MSGNLTGLGFDASKEEPNKGFDIIPKQDLLVCITESPVKESKANSSNRYVGLKLQVCQQGDYQNRILFHNLNLWNSNAQAVQIARGDLSAICRAVGIATPNDTSELHNKPFIASVDVKVDKDGKLTQVIRAFKPRHNGPSGPSPTNQAPQSQPGQSQQPSPAANGSPFKPF